MNSIKPWIKFNWVHKHLLLDFSSSNWIFLINRLSLSNFNLFAFLNLLNQFWHFFGIPATLFSLLLFFGFLLIYYFCIFLYFFHFFVGNPKMGNNRFPLFTMLMKQNIINVMHSKLVKKKKRKKKMISLSWATCPFWWKIVYFQGRPAHTLTRSIFMSDLPSNSHWSIFTGDLPTHVHHGLFSRAT